MRGTPEEKLIGAIQMILGRMNVPKIRKATVTSVQSGTVTLTMPGATSTTPGVPYLLSYSPTANDNVMVVQDGTDIFILGKLSA